MTLETIYTHTHRPHSRLVLKGTEGKIGIFIDKSSPYHCIVKCPMTSDFVIPYAERSEAREIPSEEAAAWAYEVLCRGDSGQSIHVLQAAGGMWGRL